MLEKSCGTIPYTINNGTIHYLLVKAKDDGYCGFPKGHFVVVFSAYINKVPTKPLVGLWELFVMVISPLRTSHIVLPVLF